MVFSAFLAFCSKSKTGPATPPPDEKPSEDPIATFFKGEVKPPATQACFNGAYYRKVVSSKDKWLGIGGTVKLPELQFDENRNNPAKPGQYLDNPSIYMGGNMNGQETDIGLTWEVIKDNNGNVSPDRRAFRPFLRRTGYSSTGQAAIYQNAPAESQYYWYPGEEVEMKIELLENKKLHFSISGAGKHFEADFDCDGYIVGGAGEFKRVNAIDQVGNEGKPVQPTNMLVTGAKWKETYFFRSYEDKTVKAPAHSGRFTDMRCPGKNHFKIVASEDDLKKGAEAIDISGTGF